MSRPALRGILPPARARRALLVALLAPLAAAERAAAADLLVPAVHETIRDAIAAAAAGDRVVVAPGVYAENLDFRGKDVLVESSDGADVTVLDARGGRAASLGPGGGLVGFTVTHAAYAAGGALLVRGAGSRIERNVFDGSPSPAPGSIVLAGIAASPVLEANRFRGYACDASSTSGVLVFTGGSSPQLKNNIFEDNDCAALNMISPHSAAPLVLNNTFVRNRIGIRVDRSRPADAQVYRNNLIYANGLGLELAAGARVNDPTWEHNLVYGNVMDHTDDPDPAGALGNLSVEPALADAPAGDYHLVAGSPAVDAGSPGAMPEGDFEGTPRPLDGDGDGVASADIGAFELVPGPPGEAIAIDVLPGSDRNVLNPWRLGPVPVAVLGSEDVDVRDMDADTFRFGPHLARPSRRPGVEERDVNGDGFADLVVRFPMPMTGIALGDESACLEGEYAGAPFEACDAIATSVGLRRLFFRIYLSRR